MVKVFRKFAKILFFKIPYWTLQSNFIKFTKRLEILKILQNTDMKKLMKILQNIDKFLRYLIKH